MASTKISLNKRTFYVLSGITNTLGRSLGYELCRRFQHGSVALLVDDCEEQLQALKNDLQQQLAENQIKVLIATANKRQQINVEIYKQLLSTAMQSAGISGDDLAYFESAIIIHNEGTAATDMLLEPQDPHHWTAYVQQHLHAPVALNQAFLGCEALAGITQKIVVNVRSSLQVQPFVYSQLMCSCKKARDMYFHVIATEKWGRDLVVLNYSPGILESHVAAYDLNKNIIDLSDLNVESNLPRVKPLQSTLGLISLLEQISHVSGHDVDYYDTYVL